jgi:hypothetical protein
MGPSVTSVPSLTYNATVTDASNGEHAHCLLTRLTNVNTVDRKRVLRRSVLPREMVRARVLRATKSHRDLGAGVHRESNAMG